MAGQNTVAGVAGRAVGAAATLAAASPTGAAASGLLIYLLVRARRRADRPTASRPGD